MRIYLLKNRVNGKCYVGQTVMTTAQRLGAHRHAAKAGSSLLIHKAIRKYGWDAFDTEVLEECIDEADLDMAERFWIRCYGSQVPDGYNLESGGNLRKTHSSDSRKRMSMIRNGRMASLTWGDLADLRNRYMFGASYVGLSKRFGVSQQTVKKIVQGDNLGLFPLDVVSAQ